MDFSDALRYIKKGYSLRRSGWDGKQQFVLMVPVSEFALRDGVLRRQMPEGTMVSVARHICIWTPDNVLTPWLASQADLIANDWDIVHTPDGED